MSAEPIVIYVDADACPVKDEVYRVAGRHGLEVHVVANSYMMLPREPFIHRVVVPAGADAADDWIAGRAGPRDIVVTQDIPLASRCIAREATVLSPTGRLFTADSIGMALATRNLMQDLRDSGLATGGPRPMEARDRSRFLSALDEAVNRLKRTR